MKPKAVVGVIVIVVFGAFAAWSLGNNLNPYVGFEEAAQASGKVQVWGYLVEGEKIAYDLKNKQLRFYLEDDAGTRALVAYEGAKPDNLEHAEGVGVIGRFEGDIFLAERLLVKCPSKYEEEAKESGNS